MTFCSEKSNFPVTPEYRTGSFGSPFRRLRPAFAFALALGFLALFCLPSSLTAQEHPFFVSLGAEGNMNTRKGAALGGDFLAGYQFHQLWAFGLKTTFSGNMDTITVLEPSAFLRMSLPLSLWGLKDLGVPFVQYETGMSLLFENRKTVPVYAAGLAVGWRFDLGDSWYIEPAIRGGYPYMVGGGVTAGLRFAGNNASGGAK